MVRKLVNSYKINNKPLSPFCPASFSAPPLLFLMPGKGTFRITELSHSSSCVVTSLSTLSVLRSASFNQMLFFSSCSSASLLEHPIFYPFGCQEDAGWWMSGQWSPCHGAKVHRCCQELLQLCRLAVNHHKSILQLRKKFKGSISKPKDIRENIRKEFFGTWSPSLAAVVSKSAHTPPWSFI